MKKLAVVAFGGNALLRSGQKGTIDEQETNVYESCMHLLELVKNGYDLVIGHGNGPQVGNVMLQHDAGEKTYGVPGSAVGHLRSRNTRLYRIHDSTTDEKCASKGRH